MRLIIKCVFATNCKVFYPFVETTISIVSVHKTKSPALWTLSLLVLNKIVRALLPLFELIRRLLGRNY
ncbi:hypothetical protein F9H62_25415 [Vibrio alginolyticus]|nr:hypothetical protein [Vibrio alginolyticus]EGQ9181371.1 hypothetical protein [Vibrio alginolyticus]